MLKTCKHPYKVSKATPGAKIIDILLCLAKNKEFGGGMGVENIDNH